ncbi:FAD-dependent monooxygenase [Bradyrhizobium australiense]|uniref:FAD-binding protein n=1 Tax=Bradyrhizobium australiense TaxID=2721161 RepID=A0A7Y4LYT1_9BRAD|nr:FAD-dependent monooxygenase [Bradyrhizobium australiense]NOJ43604.1 FAD-binding protein [Bradyrhizobium australiense]
MRRKLEVAIAGGGIGGLTAALALQARGLNVAVFEQAPAFREIGSGIALGANAVRLLNRIGLENCLKTIGSANNGLMLLSHHGVPVTTSSRATTPPPAGNAGGYTVHRAEFVSLLIDAQPEGTLHFGHRCVRAEETSDRVRLTFASGATIEADIFVGADGIHSVGQREIGLETRPTSEGCMAYRGVIPAERLPWANNLNSLKMWIGSGRSFICYPVSRGRLINVVAFVPTDRECVETWSAPGDLNKLAAEYSDWDAPVLQMIGALDETFCWGIYDRAPLPYWSTARMTLLGDAAHPMVPHFGQGAGQAIEDGFALAVLLEHAATEQVPARLRAYQRLRIERTSRVQAISREAGRFYRSEHRNASEREQQLASWTSAGRWIFGYDVEEAARELLSEVA